MFLYGNWDLIIFTVMYHTVTSNHGNLAFCTVIFCTVMVNVLYYGNGRHGVNKCGLWFITVTNATVTVIVFFHGNVTTVITEGS